VATVHSLRKPHDIEPLIKMNLNYLIVKKKEEKKKKKKKRKE